MSVKAVGQASAHRTDSGSAAPGGSQSKDSSTVPIDAKSGLASIPRIGTLSTFDSQISRGNKVGISCPGGVGHRVDRLDILGISRHIMLSQSIFVEDTV